MARHAVNHAVHTRWLASHFPWGTLVVNVAGCLVVGTLAGLTASGRVTLPYHWREFLFVGLLGGFTTFSTFGLDTLALARSHSAFEAAANVGLHVGGGLIAVWLGYLLAARA
jgi:CrcB protein